MADTAEFQLTEGQWTSESGERVEVGAILAENAADAGRVRGIGVGRTLSAT